MLWKVNAACFAGRDKKNWMKLGEQQSNEKKLLVKVSA